MFSVCKTLASAGVLILLVGTPAPDAPIEVNITLNDYSFSVEGQSAGEPIQLQVGQDYQLHIINASALMMMHEVLFGRNPLVLDSGAHLDYTEPMLTDVDVTLGGELGGQEFSFESSGMYELEIGSGQTFTLEFTLPDSKIGDWELGCFSFLSMDNNDDNPGPTHYDAGMHLPVVVSAA